jgi:hypothetical protein
MLLFVFDGLFLLRFAERQFLALLFQLPPRFTRFEPVCASLKTTGSDQVAAQTQCATVRHRSKKRGCTILEFSVVEPPLFRNPFQTPEFFPHPMLGTLRQPPTLRADHKPDKGNPRCAPKAIPPGPQKSSPNLNIIVSLGIIIPHDLNPQQTRYK